MSQLRSGPNGFSYTQQIQYASIQVSFLSLSATGSFSQEVDPLRIEIEGDNLSAAGLDFEPASTGDGLSTNGDESSLAPVARAALLESPIQPRPPAGPSSPAIYEYPASLTEGFTPELRLHI